MGIVRGLDGRFFEIEDEVLNKSELKKEDIPPPPTDLGPPVQQGLGRFVEITIRVPVSPGGPAVQVGSPLSAPTESLITWFNGYPNWMNLWNNT